MAQAALGRDLDRQQAEAEAEAGEEAGADPFAFGRVEVVGQGDKRQLADRAEAHADAFEQAFAGIDGPERAGRRPEDQRHQQGRGGEQSRARPGPVAQAEQHRAQPGQGLKGGDLNRSVNSEQWKQENDGRDQAAGRHPSCQRHAGLRCLFLGGPALWRGRPAVKLAAGINPSLARSSPAGPCRSCAGGRPAAQSSARCRRPYPRPRGAARPR